MLLNASVAQVRDVILQAKLVNAGNMRSALSHIEKWGGRLPRVLAEMNFAEDFKLVEALSKAFQIPLASLELFKRDAATRAQLDAEYCRIRGVLPMQRTATHLMLAMVDPTDTEVLREVETTVKCRVVSHLISELQLLSILEQEVSSTSRLAAVDDLLKPSFDVDSLTSNFPTPGATSNAPLASTSTSAAKHALTDRQLQRLHALEVTQQRTSQVISALQALLRDRGL
jgi:Type II secretion system (T2SS), protein E, N-terminal domain